MKKDFQNFFSLNQVVKIYIPGTINVSQFAPELRDQFTGEAIALFTKCFGGATVSPAVGAWMDANNNIVKENINIVYAFCTPDQMAESYYKIFEFGYKVCKEMQQEAVSLEYNNQLGFIEL